MAWPTEEFFLTEGGDLDPKRSRPLGQGDIIEQVPLPRKLKEEGQQVTYTTKRETVVVVASSCGMRKSPAGALNPNVHVAPAKRLASLAPSWESPYDPSRFLQLLPLPGLDHEEPRGANLGQITLAPSEYLVPGQRLAVMSEGGLADLKARLSSYFSRVEIPSEPFRTGAQEDRIEMELWERWIDLGGDESAFQDWLDEPNPNIEVGTTRRTSLVADHEGIREQLADALASD